MWRQVTIDSVKALIPFKNQARRALRSVRPYASLPDNDEYALKQGAELVAKLLAQNAEIGTVLEIGTGWMPTVPFVFHAAGAKKLWLTDVEPLMDEVTLAAAARFVESRLPDIAAITGIALETLSENLNKPLSYDYLCPLHFEEVEGNLLDLVYSRTVLEHIAPATLAEMLSEMHRVIRPGGMSAHIIDNSDHFEHADKRLTRVNFLQYSSAVWRLTHLNAQAYQNRLRHSDYVMMFEASPFELVHTDAVVDERALTALEKFPLHSDFTQYSKEDLAALTSWIIARKT